MPSYLPFKEIAESIDVEAVAKHVGVALKRSGKELRGACPSCRSDEERSLALFPETNSFRCYASQLSGDSIALYGHLTGTGMYQSAKHLQDQFAPATAGRQNTAPATAPQKPGVSPSSPTSRAAPALSRAPGPFDPARFAAKLEYTEEVAVLGFTEEDAARFSVGFYRGKVYMPLRDENGAIAGFIGYAEGQLKLPPRWLPPSTNVVHFPKTA